MPSGAVQILYQGVEARRGGIGWWAGRQPTHHVFSWHITPCANRNPANWTLQNTVSFNLCSDYVFPHLIHRCIVLAFTFIHCATIMTNERSHQGCSKTVSKLNLDQISKYNLVNMTSPMGHICIRYWSIRWRWCKRNAPRTMFQGL